MIRYHNCADLHVHTNASDGAFAPAVVASMAREAGLEIISITDHDNVAAHRAAFPAGIEVIAGVELSAELDDREVHVLGYYIDATNARLLETLADLRRRRRERFQAILDKLATLDIFINPEDLVQASEDCSVGRLHVAQLLIERGYAANIYEAFRDYLGTNGKAFVPKTRFTVPAAIDLVHSVGGAAVLAHPGNFFTTDQARAFVEKGLDGVEAFYPTHSQMDSEKWAAFAADNHILTTAGSDFHGRVNDTQLGAARMPRKDVEALHARSRLYAGRLS